MPLGPLFFCHLLGASQGYTPGCGGHEQGHSSLGAGDMGIDAWSIISIEGTYSAAKLENSKMPTVRVAKMAFESRDLLGIVAKCHS